MKIEPFSSNDLRQLPALQPEGWGDITVPYSFYLQHPFCFPFSAIEGMKLVGIGTCVVHHRSAWLCHIIVHNDERNKGIGKGITDHLIHHARQLSCETISLIATALGAPVYRKAGFEVESEYVFYKGGAFSSEIPADIIRYAGRHKDLILALDKEVSGENRSQLLSMYLTDCWIVSGNDQVDGFYLPSLGDGVIIAKTPSAGKALMLLRAKEQTRFCIPEQNFVASDFLVDHGYQSYQRGTRMYMGKKLNCTLGYIYNRIGGNLG
jgi:hypothetical protein